MNSLVCCLWKWCIKYIIILIDVASDSKTWGDILIWQNILAYEWTISDPFMNQVFHCWEHYKGWSLCLLAQQNHFCFRAGICHWSLANAFLWHWSEWLFYIVSPVLLVTQFIGWKMAHYSLITLYWPHILWFTIVWNCHSCSSLPKVLTLLPWYHWPCTKWSGGVTWTIVSFEKATTDTIHYAVLWVQVGSTLLCIIAVFHLLVQ